MLDCTDSDVTLLLVTAYCMAIFVMLTVSLCFVEGDDDVNE
jgi:hypothetical protein